MGSGSAMFFMELEIKVTTKTGSGIKMLIVIGSGINILGKNMGSVTKTHTSLRLGDKTRLVLLCRVLATQHAR